MPPAHLDVYISSFIQKLSKPDGTDYEPDSLTSFHRGIDRALQDKGYEYSLVTSKEFRMSKKMLETRRKELKASGKGNRPNKAEALTGEEEEALWNTGQMGGHSPVALQYALWYLTTKLLGFRGCQETRQLRWGDMELVERGNEKYIEYSKERLTKTRTGNTAHERAFHPRLFQNINAPERCPVLLYIKFRDLRPPGMLDADSPFFLKCKSWIFKEGRIILVQITSNGGKSFGKHHETDV